MRCQQEVANNKTGYLLTGYHGSVPSTVGCELKDPLLYHLAMNKQPHNTCKAL